ncbi:MAG: sigma-54-dependent Fis family transcriptional regulator [Candidatus Rokubacteria bacterium]|nr:sigma-54-dependent Fis family transcriptional regulator [Candidatus Rokubacteria bacterium]
MADARVLVVDDEPSMRELLGVVLRKDAYDVVLVDGGEAAIEAIRAEVFDLVITDLRMRKVDGLAVLRAAKEHSPQTVVLVVTAYASTETAVEAMKAGAYDYITKPFKLDEIRLTIANALERKRLVDENQALRRQLRQERSLEAFVGKSRTMLDVLDTIRKIADSASTVMITGESGTGKELVARAIHQESPRRKRPFVSVNCGAVPESLMESELFGHVKGAFTGAVASTIGLFAAADGGTLFLDEMTEIPPSVQVKLLRAIQEREIRRVGDTRDIKVDARLIAASNRDLAKAVADGTLREDLFYRLNVIPIHLPPLRDRVEDIPLLVAHFIEKIAREVGKTVRGISPEALAILERYRWPGNIRELENVIERAIVLGSGETLTPDELPPDLCRPQGVPTVPVHVPTAGIDLEGTLDQIERQYIELALQRTGGVQTRAAELLKLSFRQFRYKLQKHAQRLSKE